MFRGLDIDRLVKIPKDLDFDWIFWLDILGVLWRVVRGWKGGRVEV